MASQVYSHSLWATVGDGGFALGPIVPETEVWVVRTVTVQMGGGGFYTVASWVLVDTFFIPICGWNPPYSASSEVYTWNGRHVLEPGTQMRAEWVTDFPAWRVSGYKLKLP